MNPNSVESTPSRKFKISFFGHFGSTNFGNEGTLIACLSNIKRLLPEAEFRCICTGPSKAVEVHKIPSMPVSPQRNVKLPANNRLMRFIDRLILGVPFELYTWLEAYVMLGTTDMLIIPGTGIISDSFGLLSWGAYNLLKWSLMAKLRGCRLYFVSVGAGPLKSYLGRRFSKWALGLADYRSFRDSESIAYMKDIGFARDEDAVYPDLCYSLPDHLLSPNRRTEMKTNIVIGIGAMYHGSMYGDGKPDALQYAKYLDALVSVIKTFIDRGHSIQLLSGEETGDVSPDFCALLEARLKPREYKRVNVDQAKSVEALLSQISNTDLVIATRYHNIVFSLINQKPVIALSPHSKCSSVMNSMGLSNYCVDITDVSDVAIIELVKAIELDIERVDFLIKSRNSAFRNELETQYQIILNDAKRAMKQNMN